MNRSVDAYRDLLDKMRQGVDSPLSLANLDLDTGNVTKPGTYPRTDRTYAELLDRLTARPERIVPALLKKNILDYYSNPNAPIATKKNRKAWNRVTAQLEILQEMKAGPPEEWSPTGNVEENGHAGSSGAEEQ